MPYPLKIKSYKLRLRKDGYARCFEQGGGVSFDPHKPRFEIWVDGVLVEQTPFKQYAVGFTDGYNKMRSSRGKKS